MAAFKRLAIVPARGGVYVSYSGGSNLGKRKHTRWLEVWEPNWQMGSVQRGISLRFQKPATFRLCRSGEWQTVQHTTFFPPALGISNIPETQADAARGCRLGMLVAQLLLS